MKYLKQFAIIIFASFAGELMNCLIPLPIPASIYGFLILFAGLSANIIPQSSVSGAAHFLIEIMPVTFIPAAVGLIVSYDILKPLLVPYIAITAVSTFAVMFVAGRVTQSFIHAGKKGEK